MAFKLPKLFDPAWPGPGVKPTVEVEIDWDNPLSNGIISYLPFNGLPERSLINNGNFTNNSAVIQPEGGELVARFATADTSDNEYITDTTYGAFLLTHKGVYEFSPGAVFFSFTPDTVSPADQLGVLCYGLNGGTSGLYIYVYGGNLKIGCGVWNTNLVTHSLTAGETYNCVYSVDGTVGTLFVNGVNVGTHTADATVPTGVRSLEIGRIFEGLYGNCLNGTMGQVVLYDRALTDAEGITLSQDPYQLLKPTLESYAFLGAAAAGGDTEILATTATLTIATNSATVANDINISATTDTFTVTTNAATVSNDVNITANTASLTLTANAATVANNINITATTDTFTVTTNSATVTYTPVGDTVISAVTATLTLATNSATVANDVNITASLASLTLTANSATVANDVNIAATTKALTLTTLNATVAGSKNITCNFQALTLITFPCNVQGGAVVTESEFTGGWDYPERPDPTEERIKRGIIPQPDKPKRPIKKIPVAFDSVKTLEEAAQEERTLRQAQAYHEEIKRRGKLKTQREEQDRDTLIKIHMALNALQTRKQQIEEQDVVFMMMMLVA